VSDSALRRSPLHTEHVALGARLVAFAGWQLPIQYSGIVEEHRAVRNAAGLFDVSHMGEMRLRGQHAAQVVNYLVTSDARKLVDGQAMYTCACNELGRILDDLIVYRRTEQDWLVVCNGANRTKMTSHFARAAEHHCDFQDESDVTALMALQGPKAVEILGRLEGGAELGPLKAFHFREAKVASIPCTVARTGYTGEDGVEMFCRWDDAPALWRSLMGIGDPPGLKPAGLGARDTLRLEARLSLYGNDIDESTDPLEGGLGWIVSFTKGDFVGKAALETIRQSPLSRRLVGFEMIGRGIARHGYPLRDRSESQREVGRCTSGGPGPTVGKNIGLGYLPLEMTAVGTRFLVDCRGKNIEAVVVQTPFYKRPSRGAKT
jgi:aminomethyltransferase